MQILRGYLPISAEARRGFETLKALLSAPVGE